MNTDVDVMCFAGGKLIVKVDESRNSAFDNVRLVVTMKKCRIE